MDIDLNGYTQRIRRALGSRIGTVVPRLVARRIILLTAGIAALVLVIAAKNVVGLTVGLALAGVVWLSEIVRAGTSSRSWLSSHSVKSRNYMILLLVGIGAIYSSLGHEMTWMMWVSMFLMAVSMSLVCLQGVFLKTQPLIACNFRNNPEVGRLPRIQVRGLLRFLWAIFLLHAILAVTSLPFSPWVSSILSLVSLALVSWFVIGAGIWAYRARWRTLRELRRLSPIAMMPYGGSAAFHIPMWESYVREIEVPYFILTLKEHTVPELAKVSNAPIISPNEVSAEAIDSIVPQSVQIAFYVHNSADNRVFLQNDDIVSVWIHHGDGDKIASYRAKSSAYDYLFVAGQGAIDRYSTHGVDIPAEKFRIIGRPQTESITVEDRHIAEIHPQTVLYAPTWHGKKAIENYSSLEFGTEIVRALIARNANVIFRPHPASKSSAVYRGYIKQIQDLLAHDSSHSDRIHTWGEQAEVTWSVADAANASDAMVSDVSGIVTDYMHSKKPFAMVTLKLTKAEFTEDFPTSRASYVITHCEASLNSALDDMLGADPLKLQRRQARINYLGGFEGRASAQQFVTESRALLRG